MAKPRARNAATAGVLFAFVFGMVGLAYASVPLYKLFCQVTGYAGTPVVDKAAPTAVSDRMITVRFDANVNAQLPWRFSPDQREMKVRLGETALATYTAKNVSAGAITGTASFNVTPFKAGPYFGKVDCFCFTEQVLAPGQEVSMPVSFYVDPEIFTDIDTQDVNTITLSYTFHRMQHDASVDVGTRTPLPRQKG